MRKNSEVEGCTNVSTKIIFGSKIMIYIWVKILNIIFL